MTNLTATGDIIEVCGEKKLYRVDDGELIVRYRRFILNIRVREEEELQKWTFGALKAAETSSMERVWTQVPTLAF